MEYKIGDIVKKTSRYADPCCLYRIEGISPRPSAFGKYPAGTLQYHLVSCNIGEKSQIRFSEFEDGIILA